MYKGDCHSAKIKRRRDKKWVVVLLQVCEGAHLFTFAKGRREKNRGRRNETPLPPPRLLLVLLPSTRLTANLSKRTFAIPDNLFSHFFSPAKYIGVLVTESVHHCESESVVCVRVKENDRERAREGESACVVVTQSKVQISHINEVFLFCSLLRTERNFLHPTRSHEEKNTTDVYKWHIFFFLIVQFSIYVINT